MCMYTQHIKLASPPPITYCYIKSVLTSIEGICDVSKVAQGFANSFSNNFYDSASNNKLKNVF